MAVNYPPMSMDSLNDAVDLLLEIERKTTQGRAVHRALQETRLVAEACLGFCETWTPSILIGSPERLRRAADILDGLLERDPACRLSKSRP